MFCHFLFATGKILEKIQIIWGRAIDNLMFEGKSYKLKICAKLLGAGYMRSGVCFFNRINCCSQNNQI